MTGQLPTDALLDRLAADAKAKGAVAPWPYRLIVFFALASSIVSVTIGLVVAGNAVVLPAGDEAIVGWWTLISAAALFVVGTVAAIRLAMPGRDVGGMTRYLVALLLATLTLAIAARSLPMGTTWSDGLHAGWSCSLTLLIFAIAPLAMLAIALRTGAPVGLSRAGRWAALAGVALGLVAVDLCCPSEHPGHLLVYHLGAAAIVASVASVALRRWLRW